MFGEKIKLSNRVVFLETKYTIAFVNIKPIVPGRKCEFFLLDLTLTILNVYIYFKMY